MIGHVGVNATDHARLVGHATQVADVVGVLDARLAVVLKCPWRGEDPGTALDQGVLETGQERRRNGLAVEFPHRRLGIEKIQLAGGTGHEDENHVASPRSEVRFVSSQRMSATGSQAISRQEVPQRDSAQSTGCPLQEGTAAQRS